jgi:hypothetical protein
MDRRSAILLPGAALLAAGSGLWVNSPPAEAQPPVSAADLAGPWGGPDGDPFSDDPVPPGSRIQQLSVYVGYGPVLMGMQTTYLNADGSIQQLPLRGQSNDLQGKPIQPNVLQFQKGEVLKGIRGKWGQINLIGSYQDFADFLIVLGLAIYTNLSVGTNKPKGQFGFFDAGEDFQYMAPRRKEIFAFHGRTESGLRVIEAIGIKTRKSRR